MHLRSLVLIVGLLATPGLASSPALAHAHLAKASPAANATGAAPAVIQLQFSERVEPRFSGVELSGPGGAKIATVPQPASKDGKTIAARVPARLAPGGYRVGWHVVSADGHRITGAYGFNVR